jgi:TonB family protein
MRSASFFILSVTLHAAALVYPITFSARNHGEAISVTILPVEPELIGEGGSGGSGGSAPRSASNSPFAARPAVATSVESKTVANPDRQTLTAEIITTFSDDSIALVSDISHTKDNVGAAISGVAVADTNGSSDGLGGIGDGNGFHSSGTGFGRGSGHGNGRVLSGAGAPLTQARYRDTPRPHYPDSARREGREGRVLLRVLVDDQGRSKRVEINSSSGSDALDRAAQDAIKLWRFHPARAGDRPIESWVSIPIEFQLTDLRN